ncbi:aromatic ring-hydroxylating oxygenase subunit alpha [Anatilimnocola floriformis]|uniref:aromatic ring-hydroxylating oxygenase subunit alpha n=1 Tax=Anatilimnocola floriformis TaxID=2948575 RepID=UPI0020C333BC|nr:aromatic ring-hydroxylating dioxygenase subunit alpha [Anatilimnocola floriformis]
MTTLADRLGQHWLVCCEAAQLGRKPLSVNVLGTPLVVFRSSTGIIVAEDRCPHRNAPLSLGQIERGELTCPYHGWRFGEAGRCVAAPGICADPPNVTLRCWQADEFDGWVWVAAPTLTSARRMYRSKLAENADYENFNMTAALDSTLPDAIENLLDATHTPFVHAGLIRSAKAKQSFTAVVRRSNDLVEAEYRGEKRQHGLISRLFEPEREVSFGRFIPPFTAELEYRSPARTELLVVSHFTPADTGKTNVFVKVYLPKGRLPSWLRLAIARLFFCRVLKQDSEILASQSRNIARFGKQAYTFWQADLLRPWIDAWLRDGEFPAQAAGPETVCFEL